LSKSVLDRIDRICRIHRMRALRRGDLAQQAVILSILQIL